MRKPWLFARHDLPYLIVCLVFVAALSYSIAMQFESYDLRNRALLSLAYLGISAAYAIRYCALGAASTGSDTTDALWNRAIMSGFLMVLASDLSASLARGESVLIVAPSLFCLAGSATGATFTLAYLDRAHQATIADTTA